MPARSAAKRATTTGTAFATSQFSRSRMVAGDLRREPASEVHAKVMGTPLTLCGTLAFTWVKFWDTPFWTVRESRCTQCVEALVQSRART